MPTGVHHVSVLSGDPQRTVDFYGETLGLRTVKRTVNYEDPMTHHIYFGDDAGRPGTVLSVYPVGDGRSGSVGTGQVTTVSVAVPRGSLGDWRERIACSLGAADAPRERFGNQVLSIRDPDGTRIDLVAAGVPSQVEPHTCFVDDTMAIGGLYGITIDSTDPTATAELLSVLGFDRVDAGGDRARFRGSAAAGAVVDVVDSDREYGREGPGTVHHAAVRAADEAALAGYRTQLHELGRRPTEIKDKQYFQSVYVRDPGGALLEVATDGPGFTVDEPQAELGTDLQLPPWLEDERDSIRLNLPTVDRPNTSTMIESFLPQDAPKEYHANEETVTAGTQLADATGAVVALHGRGASARSISGLAQRVTEDSESVAILAPQARGNTWYPNSFLAPIDENQPALASALTTVGRTVDRAENAGIDRGRIVLLGFSQGACLAAEWAAQNGCGGLAALSGGLIGPEDTPREYDTDLDGAPVFLGCSDRDPHIPAERVHETADVLSELGADVTTQLYQGMGHTVAPEEIDRVRDLVATVCGDRESKMD